MINEIEATMMSAPDATQTGLFIPSTNEAIEMPEYSITSYGADFDVEGLVRRLNDNDIEIPEFQRRFVWTQERASRFIESLLVGLPVPGIFLYREVDSESLQVIDGQQRLRTLQAFFRGKAAFGSSTEKKFDIQGKGIESKFIGLTYDRLEEKYRRKLHNSIIHATVIRQTTPDDGDSSKYFVFERLNTEASQLSGQEIRAAIYQGQFNDLIRELNLIQSWRVLFGRTPNPDKRKRDEELILRFFALYVTGAEKYSSPMKDFLNDFMSRNRHLSELDEELLRGVFESTVESILRCIGGNAFKPYGRRNAAVTEAVMVGIARSLKGSGAGPSKLDRYERLVKNLEFSKSVSRGTSQTQNVRSRIKLAIEAFADVE